MGVQGRHRRIRSNIEETFSKKLNIGNQTKNLTDISMKERLLTAGNDNTSAEVINTEPCETTPFDKPKMDIEIKIEEPSEKLKPKDTNTVEISGVKSKENQILENIKCINMIMVGKLGPSLNIYDSKANTPSAANHPMPFFSKNSIMSKIEGPTKGNKRHLGELDLGLSRFSQKYKRSLEPTPTNKQQMRKANQLFESRRDKSYNRKGNKVTQAESRTSFKANLTQPRTNLNTTKGQNANQAGGSEHRGVQKSHVRTQKSSSRISYRASPMKDRFPQAPSLKELQSSGEEDNQFKKQAPSKSIKSRESSINLVGVEKNTKSRRQSKFQSPQLESKIPTIREDAQRKSHKKVLSVHIPNSTSNPFNGFRLNLQNGNNKMNSFTPGPSCKNSPSKKTGKKINIPGSQPGNIIAATATKGQPVIDSDKRSKESLLDKPSKVTSDNKRGELTSRKASIDNLESFVVSNSGNNLPVTSPSHSKNSKVGKFSFNGSIVPQQNKAISFGQPKTLSASGSHKLRKANSGIRDSNTSKPAPTTAFEQTSKMKTPAQGGHTTKKSGDLPKKQDSGSLSSKVNPNQGSNNTGFSTGGAITSGPESLHQQPETVSLTYGPDSKPNDDKTVRKRFNNTINNSNIKSGHKLKKSQNSNSEIRIDVCINKKNVPTFGDKLHNLGPSKDADERSIISGQFSSKSFNFMAKSSRAPSEDLKNRKISSISRKIEESEPRNHEATKKEIPKLDVDKNGENSEPVEIKQEANTVRFAQQNNTTSISEAALTFCDQLANSKSTLIEKITESYQQNLRLSHQNFYRVIPGKIGKGSFGKVYSAISILTGETAAVKCLSMKAIRSKPAYNKVRREIAIHRQLQNSNIVRLYEVFETESNIYFVMEYANNGDLLSMVKKGYLQESYAKEIISKIILALEYCHSKKVLHRDIKLDNILLSTDGSVKLCDFGISIYMEDDKLEYDQSGTPAYIAPEILKGDGYSGFKADVWSLGITIYTMLTGTIPFHARETDELHALILEGVFDFPNTPKLSPEIKDLLKRILVLDPMARLSLAEVKAHAWFEPVFAGLEAKHYPFEDQQLDEQVVSEIESYGFPKKLIEDTVLNSAINHIYACYAMLQLKDSRTKAFHDDGSISP